ncbi:hypothetical protein LLG95_18315, partial [bacterium]|nr:hypothetical protein [bacterium]
MIAEPEFCVRVCETLLHSLWQGAAIAAAALVAGRLMRHRSAQARYGLFVMALGIVALCPAATFWWLGPDSIAPASTRPETRATAQADAVAPVALPSAANASAAAASPAVATPAATNEFTLRQYAPHFVTVYAVGVVAMIAHLLFALRGGVRLRRKSLKIEDLALVDSLSRAARVIGLPFVPALAWCERVGAPTVVGIVRPAILIPLSLANGLSPEQVELLLMHELAHLKRHDHWVNLA